MIFPDIGMLSVLLLYVSVLLLCVNVLLLLDLALRDPWSPTLLARCVRRLTPRGRRWTAPHPHEASSQPMLGPPAPTRPARLGGCPGPEDARPGAVPPGPEGEARDHLDGAKPTRVQVWRQLDHLRQECNRQRRLEGLSDCDNVVELATHVLALIEHHPFTDAPRTVKDVYSYFVEFDSAYTRPSDAERSDSFPPRSEGEGSGEGLVPRREAQGRRHNASGQSHVGESQRPSPPRYPIRPKLAMAHILCPAPVVQAYPGKDDDRISCTAIAQQWPLIIVADGASGRIDPGSAEVVAGGGGQAAHVVVEVIQRALTDVLQRTDTTVQALLTHLRQAYPQCVEALAEREIAAATTLLVALLYERRTLEGHEAWWCYAFEGDGSIVVMNPRRTIDGKLLRTELLVPGQKMETTATVSRDGCSVPPIVGCLAYEPGDILYVASDGMDAVEHALYTDQSTFLANYLYGQFRDDPAAGSLQATLSSFRDLFSDDAVLGLIWTSERPV